MKTARKNAGKALADRLASRIEARLTRSFAVDPRTTPATKIGQLQLWHHYRTQIEAGHAPKLHQTGFRCFSQFEEDGMILFIMAALGILEGIFLDLGSADGVNSSMPCTFGRLAGHSRRGLVGNDFENRSCGSGQS